MTTQTLKVTQLPNAGVLSGTERVPVVQGGATKQATTQQIADLFSGLGAGTVTSVGLSAPGMFTVAGSPVTTSGTLALALADQSANLFFGGPSSGADAAPTFRPLASADLPIVPISKGGTGETGKVAAFDALAPTTTRGDIIVRGASTNDRLALGTEGYALLSSGTDPVWGAPLDIVTPQMFGAVVDGVTDDAAAFTAADATGKNVYVPSGTYLVDGNPFSGNPGSVTQVAWIFSPGARFVGTGSINGSTSLYGVFRYAERGVWTSATGGANLWKFKDLFRVGDASDYGGQFTASQGPMSWVGLNTLAPFGTSGAMAYFDTRTQFASWSTFGGIGVAGASRTSDDPDGYSACIGVGSFADNNLTTDARPAWAYYGHAIMRPGASASTFAMELECGNQNSASVALDPYQMGVDGTTATIWAGVGGETVQIEGNVAYPVNCAIGIITSAYSTATAWAAGEVVSAGDIRLNTASNGYLAQYTALNSGTTGLPAPTGTVLTTSTDGGGVQWFCRKYITDSRYLKGIVFQATALDGTAGTGTGTGIAVEMARGHEIRWKYSGSEAANCGLIRGDMANAATQQRIVFAPGGIDIRGVQSDFETENVLFRVVAPTITGSNGTNYLQVTPTETGGGLVTVAVPSGAIDTNVAIKHSTKGSGNFQIAPGGTTEIEVSSTALYPTTTGGSTLGQTGNGFSALYLTNASQINFANGNLVIQHAAGALGISGVTTLASTTATPAGGSTSARLLFGTTAGFGVYYGSGAPTVTAAQGSIYLRSDGSSTSTRLYVNTDGGTTWTNVTTAA